MPVADCDVVVGVELDRFVCTPPPAGGTTHLLRAGPDRSAVTLAVPTGSGADGGTPPGPTIAQLADVLAALDRDGRTELADLEPADRPATVAPAGGS